MKQPVGQSNSSLTSKSPLTLIIISVFVTAVLVGGGFYWWANLRLNESRNQIDSLNNQLLEPSSQTPDTAEVEPNPDSSPVAQNQLLDPSALTPAAAEDAPIPDSSPVTQSDLNGLFELSKKEPGTKIYYSDMLGVGFTYLTDNPNDSLLITESDNKIIVGQDQFIEVFTKDPKISLEAAIEDRFLKGYNPTDCFVKTYSTSEQELSYYTSAANYVTAGISYPRIDDPDVEWWFGSNKCPENYSEANAVLYFLMNKEVPDKYLFLSLGHEPGASDGFQTEESGGWYHSIRILK